jgi:hypothetical protein
MSKRIAIIQSNYIPWKGYFNIIKCVDEFVLLDDVQYTRRDWRNRNLIKTPGGLKWLTIPVEVKGRYHARIREVQTAGDSWRRDHWALIREAYRKAAHFSWFSPLLEEAYLGNNERSLSKINFNFISLINGVLQITTPVRWSMDFDSPDEKSERLLGICKALNGTDYISGIAAKEYLQESLFNQNNIQVRWADYSGYPEYRQLHGPFEHGVSIIDLLFNEGPASPGFLKDKIWV